MDFEYQSLPHGGTETTIFRWGDFVYATDFKKFSSSLIKAWKGKIRVMVASGVMFRPHHSHSSIQETLELFNELKVEKGFITHMSHMVSHEKDSKNLPKNIKFAYDGMILDL